MLNEKSLKRVKEAAISGHHLAEMFQQLSVNMKALNAASIAMGIDFEEDGDGEGLFPVITLSLREANEIRQESEPELPEGVCGEDTTMGASGIHHIQENVCEDDKSIGKD